MGEQRRRAFRCFPRWREGEGGKTRHSCGVVEEAHGSSDVVEPHGEVLLPEGAEK